MNDNYKCINDKSYPVNENGFVALTIISLIITVNSALVYVLMTMINK